MKKLFKRVVRYWEYVAVGIAVIIGLWVGKGLITIASKIFRLFLETL